MQLYLALFRGINVSGKKIIKMEDLRKLMEASDYNDVKTYIQSGNVIFKSNLTSKSKIAADLESLIQKEYGFDVTIFIVDINDVNKAVDNNPFAKKGELEEGTKKLYVTFLSDKPSAENVDKLNQAPIGEDIIVFKDDILYFKLISKASESKLSNSLIENKLKIRATTRNWNTTLKLQEMMENYNI